MSRGIQVRLNLLRIEGAKKTTIDNQEGVFIPFGEKDFYLSGGKAILNFFMHQKKRRKDYSLYYIATKYRANKLSNAIVFGLGLMANFINKQKIFK